MMVRLTTLHPSTSPRRARMLAFARVLALVLGAGSVSAAPLGAQRRPATEFVRQTLVIAPFTGAGDSRSANRVANEVWDALRATSDRREFSVVRADSIGRMLRGLGFPLPERASETEQLLVARAARGDELLVATLRESGDTLELRGSLILVRDPRVREPLPVVRTVGPAAAGRALAQHIALARSQSDYVRRCENYARLGDAINAIREGEGALRNHPRGLLARNCLVRVLSTISVPRDSVIAVADFIIARDSASIVAHTLRAFALTAAGRGAAAVIAWQRVVSLKPDSLDLGVEAVENLFRLSRPREALAAVEAVSAFHATELRLRRQRFRALHTVARWDEAAALGDSLEVIDAQFASDPIYIVRYVESLKMRGDTLRALSKSARSVAEHPADGRLYVQYVELLSGEHRVALSRGLAKFPSLAALRVLAAQQARAAGDVGAERAELAAAVDADGSQGPVYLRLAELWFREGQADSALTVLARAPRRGEGASMLRAYIVGRGLELLRASVDSLPETYASPMALLMLADSIDSGEDSRRLVVAASLQQARAHLVVGASGQRCEPIYLAGRGLATANHAIERGMGAGSAVAELLEAHEGLRAAVVEAERVLCSVSGPLSPSGPSATSRPAPA